MVQDVAGIDTGALAPAFRGQLVHPGDEGYDGARAVWNAAFDRRPGLIARCTGTADVVAAVRFARERDLLVAVRGGGHSIPGYSTCDDGLVIDLSPMQGVWVDPAARTLRAQAGVTWGLLDREAQAYGLGITGGQITHTGIAGLTLGGGIGWLMRKLGLTCDSLLSAEVVTADGEVVRASTDENDDLFWGLRGGGGNFGIVTSFEYRLHPVGMVFAGSALYPIERAPELLRFYRDFTAEAPDELTTFAVAITAPPAPFVPEEAQGKPAFGFAACYAGPLDDGERALAPLRVASPPLVDLFQPMPYAAFQTVLDPSAPPGDSYYIKGEYTAGLPDDLIDVIVEHVQTAPGPHCEFHVGHMGGAIRHLPEDATAYGHRDAEYAPELITRWQDPRDGEAIVEWTRRFAGAMAPFAVGTYVNFLGDEGEDRVRFAYGAEKYERLVELKNRYDPTNYFRLNQNIPPG